jgi:hypothetical protein
MKEIFFINETDITRLKPTILLKNGTRFFWLLYENEK